MKKQNPVSRAGWSMPFMTILILVIAAAVVGYVLGGWWVLGAVLLFFVVGVVALVVRLCVTYVPNKREKRSAGRGVSYSEFKQLIAETSCRAEVNGFFKKYLGCTINDRDGGSVILDESGKTVDLVQLHGRIQESQSLQLELYALAMSLWR